MSAVYPPTLDVRPLTTWPGQLTPAEARERAPFSASLSSTLDLLGRELRAIVALHPVMEVALLPGQFRLDGLPRVAAQAEHPGIVLSLPSTRAGALRYAVDKYVTWQDNLRAITLGMEALRKVDRYGITRRGEQYAGFAALPPGETDRRSTYEKAVASLSAAANWTVEATRLDPVAAYRAAAKRHHPDVGGNPVVFRELRAWRDAIL